jgi:osmoprotectant transport system permease protein
VLGFTNVAQTIPSLALFGFLLPLIGIGEQTAIAALTLWLARAAQNHPSMVIPAV